MSCRILVAGIALAAATSAHAEFPPFVFGTNVAQVVARPDGYVTTFSDGTHESWRFANSNVAISSRGAVYDRRDHMWIRRGGGSSYTRAPWGWNQFTPSRDGALIRFHGPHVEVDSVRFSTTGGRAYRTN